MTIDEAQEVLETHQQSPQRVPGKSDCITCREPWPCVLREQAASIMAWFYLVGEEAAMRYQAKHFAEEGGE